MAVVLVVKSVVLLQLDEHPLLKPAWSPDSQAYVDLATQVTSGNWGLGPGLYFVSPLYVYFLAVILAPTGSFLVAKAVQIVLGTAAVGFIWMTADRWFGRRAAWVSLIIAGATGLFTFYEITLLQASLDVFLTSGFLAALTVGLLRPSGWLVWLAGLTAGIQTLNRPNVFAAAIAVGLALLCVRRWRFALLLIVGLSLGVAPVIARNRLVAGQWALATSHGGLNFFIGNSAEAGGLYRPPAGIRPDMAGQVHDTRRVAEAAQRRTLTDSEVSNYFTNLALTWIRNNPGAWLRLMAAKLYYTFHAQHIALPLSYPFFARDTGSLLGYLFIGPWFLAPVGCFGLIACAPVTKLRQYGAWITFVPAYAGAVALFFVSERYRLPLLIPLTIGAAAAMSRLWDQVQSRSWLALFRDGAVIGVLGLFLNWPLGWIDGNARLDTRIQMAQSLAASGDTAGAKRWADRGLPGNAYEVDSRLRLGRAFATAKNWESAIEYFSSAHELDRDNPSATLELVEALKAGDRTDRASEVLNSQHAVGTGNPETWLGLGRVAMSLRLPTKAEQFFSRAVDLAPTSAAAKEDFGLALLLTGKPDGAVRHLTEATRLNPSSADAWAHLALAHLRLGHSLEATRCANAALALKPDHELARQIRQSAGGSS